MIFIDSNIPMYLVGAPHDNRKRAASLLRSMVARNERMVSDADVMQEILHRYHAIQRPTAMDDALGVLERLVDEVFTIDSADVAGARQLLGELPGLSARDALHVAVMRRHEVRRILTFDAGFDDVEGLERLA